jgi:hypothetical protein
MIGQLTTSFLQGKVSPTMTSTISNHSVDPVMVESKTGYYSGSHGVTPDTKRGGVMTVGGRVLRVLNDLLPYKLRPIKAKRVANRKRWGLGVELYTIRMRWHSHGKYEARKLKNKLQFWKK